MIVGTVAGSVVLAFLWAAHRIEPSIPFPPLLVAERIIRLTPGDVATYFIDALGPNATRLLTAMSVGMAILLAALLPRIAAVEGRPNARRAGVVVASLIGLTAFLAPQKPLLGGVAIASLMGGVLYWVALAWLIERSPGPPDPSRRQALISLTTAALGFAIGGTLVGRVDRRLAGPNTGVTIVSPELSSNAPAATAFPEIPGLAPLGHERQGSLRGQHRPHGPRGRGRRLDPPDRRHGRGAARSHVPLDAARLHRRAGAIGAHLHLESRRR